MIDLHAPARSDEAEVKDFVLEAMKCLVSAQDLLSEIADPPAKVNEARLHIEAAIAAASYVLSPNFDGMLRQACARRKFGRAAP